MVRNRQRHHHWLGQEANVVDNSRNASIINDVRQIRHNYKNNSFVQTETLECRIAGLTPDLCPMTIRRNVNVQKKRSGMKLRILVGIIVGLIMFGFNLATESGLIPFD